VAVRYANGTASGGMIDLGIPKVDALVSGIRFAARRKITLPILQQVNAVRWGDRGMQSFYNTALYPPFLYLPDVAGLWIAKLSHVRIAESLKWTRVAGGLSAIFISTVAIALAGATAPWLFVVLSLPMAQSLFAAVSQDGTMIALSALAASLTVRLTASQPERRVSALVLLCLSLCFVVMGRPPYAPLAIVPLLLPGWRRAIRLGCVAAILLLTVGWIMICTAFTTLNPASFGTISPNGQFHFLISHPGAWITIAWNTLTDVHGGWWSYAQEFTGVLGWLDVLLPVLFYKLVWVPLAVGFAASRPTTPGGLTRVNRVSLGAALAAAMTAIFLAEYLTWTPVGTLWVGGVQGRYFLPLAMFLPLMLPAAETPGRWLSPRFGLLAFPPVVICVVVPVLVYRYYI
jgi:uncharacterized membrane protein